MSKIEWLHYLPGYKPETWNPITGCTPISEGCRNCYAKRMATRLRGRCGYPADDPFRVTFHEDRLGIPMKWRDPRLVFVGSMGDLYHEEIRADFITAIYDVMSQAKQHIYIICTKRPQRLMPVLYGEEGYFYLGGGDYFPNVWHLVTAENQQAAGARIPQLMKLRSEGSSGWPVLGVSIEPMIGRVDLDVPVQTEHEDNEGYGISAAKVLDWVICGGETGPGARPMHPDWARSLRDQCTSAGVPFFFKSWGEWNTYCGVGSTEWRRTQAKPLTGKLMDGALRGREFLTTYLSREHDSKTIGECMLRVGKKRAGRLLDGREWNEVPEVKR